MHCCYSRHTYTNKDHTLRCCYAHSHDPLFLLFKLVNSATLVHYYISKCSVCTEPHSKYNIPKACNKVCMLKSPMYQTSYILIRGCEITSHTAMIILKNTVTIQDQNGLYGVSRRIIYPTFKMFLYGDEYISCLQACPRRTVGEGYIMSRVSKIVSRTVTLDNIPIFWDSGTAIIPLHTLLHTFTYAYPSVRGICACAEIRPPQYVQFYFGEGGVFCKAVQIRR